MIALLSAGKSTRVGGANKLLMDAGGLRVHEWHRRAIGSRATVAVVNSSHASQVREEAPWLNEVLEHDAHDGPGGALLAFDRAHPHGDVIVLFADTLLKRVPEVHGDWVGVADAPGRVWDYHDARAGWTRGKPVQLVCCGVYRFTDRELLRRSLQEQSDDGELNIATVLQRYTQQRGASKLIINDWQDAGDFDALKRVRR